MHIIKGDNKAGVHDEDFHSTTVYGSAFARRNIPRYELADEEMEPRMAKRFIQDELQLDGTPSLNLASFVTTFMEPEVEELMRENLNKNFIDVEEYPSLGEIESRCVNIVAKLFNAPLGDGENALGVSTVGSSEAIILAVLAAKRKWQNKRRAEGKSTDKPNLVMNAAVQVCWEKAVRYLEVEERYWYCKPGQYAADPQELVDLVDENTVLVCAILGTTYTGEYEDVEKINDLLEKKNKEAGLDVRIHVDAASGGFVAPFVWPTLKWDFRLPLVCSINTSGHKYGLAYAGVGFLVLRSKEYLPDEIIFTVNYLGSPQISFTLNFSKSAVQVIGQYYQMLRLGKNGYRAIMCNLTDTATYLAQSLEQFDDGKRFNIISKGGAGGLPLVAWSIKDENTHWDEFALARTLRQRGWIVPAYTMAPHAEKIKLLRVVCREDFSRSRCEDLIRDMRAAIKELDATPSAVLEHHSSAAKSSESPQKRTHQNATHVRHQDKHSLQGKHGKTHAVC